MRETLEVINQRLKDYYGSTENQPNWRVVFSNDQFENRYGDYEDRTPEGFLIRRYSGFRLVPKYRQWIKDKWVLEMLVEVPPNTQELATKLSYEPAYAFPFRDGRPLLPIWDAVKYLIDGINSKVGITHPRYKDPDSNPKEALENQRVRLQEIEADLFGNETSTTDALAYKQGVGFTTSKLLTDNTTSNVNSGKEGVL
jgi:hypothetical protein